MVNNYIEHDGASAGTGSLSEKYQIFLHINENEIATSLEKWHQPEPRYTRGVLSKYAKQVSSASKGAVTDN